MSVNSRLWASALVVLCASLVGSDALAQLAPTGSHYAARASDTGHSAVSGTGGYAASVPLLFPPARGDLPLPIEINYGRRGVGAAGLGWDLPLSYVQREQTVSRRRPAYRPGNPVVGREQMVVSIAGQLMNMVKTVDGGGTTIWLAQGTPDLELRNEALNVWTLRDGQGQELHFNQVVDSDFWLLTSITSIKNNNRVDLVYEVTLPSFTGGNGVATDGVAIDLVSVRYNTHPTTAGCTKNEIRFGYGAASSQPLSLSFVKYLAYVRMRTLSTIDVMERGSCGGTPQRVHRYEFSYATDPDTRLPQLQSVQLLGREGTAEANVRMPVAKYGYGTATSSGVLHYQRGADVAFPSDAAGNAPIARSYQDPQATNPVGGKTYVSWGNLLDVTGDGRPDLVFQSAGQLRVATNRPAGTSTTLSASAPLSSGPYTGRPLATYSSQVLRYQENSFQNEGNVWRQTIDVNGDGRVDIVDAAETAGVWTIYLNTPGSPVTWVKRTVSVANLRQALEARGHVISGDRIPLARRTTGFDTKMTECWKWDAAAGRYVYEDPTNANCLTSDPIVNQQVASGEMTFTEWELRDVNGDGYPDVVFNSSPVRRDSAPPSGNGNPTYMINATPTRGLRPNDGDQNSVLVAFNVAGVRIDQNVNPFSLPVTLIEHAPCGVGEWTGGDRTDPPSDEQVQMCGLEDVNGDGVTDYVHDRVVVNFGTGISSGLFMSPLTLLLPQPIRQNNPHQRVCSASSPPATYNAFQISGLRDLTGDGIPDFVELTDDAAGFKVWTVTVGTGVGFVAAVPIDTSTGFSISSTTENCSNDGLSVTQGGLYDVDGDGKPEFVRGLDSPDHLEVFHLQGARLGNPQAGRLSTIENGHGALTTITYRSAKEDASTAHQVPFPEIVVTSIETTGNHGLGGTLSAVGYAYGDATMFFDPLLDGFTMRAYGRSVEVHGTGIRDDLADRGVVTETYALPTFNPASSDAERFDRYLKVGRVRDVHVLGRNGVPRDPWALVSFNSGVLDARRMAQQHYEWTSRYTAGAAPGETLDCVDIANPYDWAQSFGYDIGHAFAPCVARGFGYVSDQTSWTGSQPPLGDYVQMRFETLTVDDHGHVLSAKNDNDTNQSDDDVCIGMTYANPTSTRMFSALASRTITDCGPAPRTRTLSAERWEYDTMPVGSVSFGRLTAHTIDRYATTTGLQVGSPIREYEISYDTAGNASFVASAREDGTLRSLAISRDEFGLAPVATMLQGTGVATLAVSIDRDPVTLDTLSRLDENGTRWGQQLDGFGRQTRVTVTPFGGALGVTSTTAYNGFVDDAAAGRTIVTTTFADPVPPANVNSATGEASIVYLDEIGRTRRIERKLGVDYGETMVELSRQFDGQGRLTFDADPYPASQNGATAYGTTYQFDSEGMLKCSIRGNGPQPLIMVSNSATELFPTCFTRTFVDHAIHISVQGPDSLSTTGLQKGVVRTDTMSAIGRLKTRETRDSHNAVLELSAHAYDRLGQTIGLTRYKTPASLAEPVTWTWSLDSMGRTLSATEPGVSARSYSYSNWGELLRVDWTDVKPKRLEYFYDALGRITSSAERDNNAIVPDTEYAWIYDHTEDPSILQSTFVAGRLSATKSSIGNMHLSYDALGRVDNRVFVEPGGEQYRELSTHRFDGALSLLELRLPDTGYQSEQYAYTYDSASRLRSVTFHDAQASKVLYTASDLDPFGRVRNAIYGENTTFTATLAQTGRRLPQKETFQTGSNQLRTIIHQTYDPVGRELVRREDSDGVTGPNTTTTYDALGRLRTSAKPAGSSPAFNTALTYDPLGNITQSNESISASQVSLTFDTTDRDRVCRIDYGPAQSGCNVTYDGVGNVLVQPMRTGGNRVFTYSPSGSVRTISASGKKLTFRHDGSGEISKLDAAGPTDSRTDRRYGLSQRRNAVINGVSQSIIERQIPGPGGSIASRRGINGTFVFPFGEERGTRFSTSNDQSGFVQEVSYLPFGEARSTIAPPSSLYYTSEQWNGGDQLADLVGLVNLGARLYDPVIGRFLSRDPLTNIRTASTTNPYAFALNDPINLSDPSGLDPSNGICATSWGGPCSGDPDPNLQQIGLLLGIEAVVGLGTSGGGGASRPEGPSLLSKDTYDTTPSGMWPLVEHGVHALYGVSTFEDYFDTAADITDGWNESIDGRPDPVASTAKLFLDGESQLLRGLRDQQRAAGRGDVAGMVSAQDDQAIGLVKVGAAVATVVAPIVEVAGVAGTAEGALTRGPASGARIVSQGESHIIRGSLERPVFEGHGSSAAGSFTVPQGTWLQVPTSTALDEGLARVAAQNGSYPAGMGRVLGPGTRIQNLVLHPATPAQGMFVRFTSWQVTRPTLLREILEPNMGFCVWAACR